MYCLQSRHRHIFATSFCESDDLLSEWRGYADGGIAIGYIHDVLVRATSGQQFHLHKCIYTTEDKEEIGRRFIETGCSPDNLGNREKITEKLAETLLLICAFFKDESFREEQEWRLVSQNAFGAYDEKRGWSAAATTSLAVIPLHSSAGLPNAVQRLRRGLRDVRDRIARRSTRWRDLSCVGMSGVNPTALAMISHGCSCEELGDCGDVCQ